MAFKQFSKYIYLFCPKCAYGMYKKVFRCVFKEVFSICEGRVFWENTTGHGLLLWRLTDRTGSVSQVHRTLGIWHMLCSSEFEDMECYVYRRLHSFIQIIISCPKMCSITQWKTTALLTGDIVSHIPLLW